MSENYNFEEWVAPATVSEYAGDFVLPEVGMYTFKLVEKGPDEKMLPKYDKTGEKKRARFYFEIIDDPDYKGQRIMQFFTISFNEKAALTPFIEAGIGRKLKGSDRVGWKQNPNDPDSVGIENIVFRAMLTHDKKVDDQGNERVYPKLSTPIPAKQSTRGRAKVEEAEPVTEEVPF